MIGAEEIALNLYPVKWHTVEVTKINGFRIDENAGKRACATDIANHFLSVLRDEKVIRGVMKAFYRREHGREPDEKEVGLLSAKMGTALLHYELMLKPKQE